uniref:Uncharacterized protein n=2 Tax=viral metagenome TaxID=1070528 RepID=A0A6M3XGH2_9ZZZZ
MAVTWKQIASDPRWEQQTPERQQAIKVKYFDNKIVRGKELPQEDLFLKWEILFNESHPEAQRIRQSKLTPTPLEVEKQPGFEFTQPKSLVDQYIGDLVKSKPRSVVDEIIPTPEPEKPLPPKSTFSNLEFPEFETAQPDISGTAMPELQPTTEPSKPQFESYAKTIQRNERMTEIDKNINQYNSDIKRAQEIKTTLDDLSEQIESGKKTISLTFGNKRITYGDTNQAIDAYNKYVNKYNELIGTLDSEKVNTDIDEYNKLMVEMPQESRQPTFQPAEKIKGRELTPKDVAKAQNVQQFGYEQYPTQFKKFYRDAMVKPFYSFLAGSSQATGGILGVMDKWSQYLGEKTGLGSGDIFEELSKLYNANAELYKSRGIKPEQGLLNDVARALYEGTGQFSINLPVLMSMGKWALPIYSGAAGGAESIAKGESPIVGTIKGAVRGTALKTLLGGSALLPRGIGEAVGGLTFGGLSLAEELSQPDKDVDWGNVVAQTLIGIALTYKQSRPTAKQFSDDLKNSFPKVKEQMNRDATVKLSQENINIIKDIFKGRGEDLPPEMIEWVKNLPKGTNLRKLVTTGEIPTTLKGKLRYLFNKSKLPEVKVPQPIGKLPPDVRPAEKIPLEKGLVELKKTEKPIGEQPVVDIGRETPQPPADVSKQPFNELSYAEHLLKNNIFTKNEVKYYMGETSKEPHGISNEVWKTAAKKVGFNEKNLNEDKGQYWLKTETQQPPKIPAIPQEKPVVERTPEIKAEIPEANVLDEILALSESRKHHPSQTIMVKDFEGFDKFTHVGAFTTGMGADFFQEEAGGINKSDVKIVISKLKAGKELTGKQQVIWDLIQERHDRIVAEFKENELPKQEVEIDKELKDENIEAIEGEIADKNFEDLSAYFESKAAEAEQKPEGPGIGMVGAGTITKNAEGIKAEIKLQKSVVGKLQIRLNKFEAKINARMQESLLGGSEAAQNEMFANAREAELQQLAKLQERYDTENAKLEDLYKQQDQLKIRQGGKESESLFNLEREAPKKPITLGAGEQKKRQTVREEDIFGKKTESQRRLNLQIKRLSMPLIGKLIKEVTIEGKIPKIYRRLSEGILGRHLKGTQDIHLLADIFIGERLYTKAFGGIKPTAEVIESLFDNVKSHFGLSDKDIYYKVIREKDGYKLRFWKIDPDYASRTMAHELFHLIDEIPDEAKRGNILGHIATLKKYMKHFLPERPGAPGELTTKDRARLKRLAQKMLKDKQFEEIVIREIKEEFGIDAKDVLSVWKDIEARGKYPELYEYIARLSRAEKVSILKDALQGKVDKVEFKRVVKISTVEEKVLRPANAEDIKRLYEKLIVDEIRKRSLFQLETIKEELKNLTMKWKPFDPKADAKYTKYRYSNNELYADAGSVLLNDPELLQEIAPTYTEAFFNWLENKPQVKKSYEQIQSMIKKGDEEIAKYLYEESKRMDLAGEDARVESQRVGKIGFVNEVIRRFVNRFQYAKMIEKGKDLQPEERVSWALDDTNYVPSIMQQYLRDINTVMTSGKKLNIDIHDLSFVAKLLRSATERQYLANPLYISGEDARATLEGFRKVRGSETVDKIVEILKNIQDIRSKIIVPLLVKDGGFSQELINYIKDNDNYWTFNVIKYINNKYARHGDNISATIFGQVGTFQDVENVIYTTLAKDYVLLKGITRRIAAKKTVEFYKKHDPENIKDAEIDKKPKRIIRKENQHIGTIMYFEDGKVVGYYLPRNIVDTFNASPTLWYDFNVIMNALSTPIKNLFVNMNLRWAIWNFTFRDPLDTYVKNPEVKLWEVYKAYIEAVPDAFMDVVFNKSTPRVRNFYLRKLLPAYRQWSYTDHGNTSFAEWIYDFIKGRSRDSRKKNLEFHSMERLFKRHGIDIIKTETSKFGKLMKGLIKTLKAPLWVLSLPSSISEKAGKIGSAQLLSEKLDNETLIRHRVRKRGGSPDYLEQGVSSAVPKTLLFFYPAWSAGWTSTIETAKETPGSFWKKIAIGAILPKLVLYIWWSGLGLILLSKWKGCRDDKSLKEFEDQLETLTNRGIKIKDLPEQKITWLEGQEGENYFVWLYHAYQTISEYDMKTYVPIPLGETPSGKIVYTLFPVGFATQPIAGAAWEAMKVAMGEADLSDFVNALKDDFSPGSISPLFSIASDLVQMSTGNNPYDARTGRGKVPESYYGGTWRDNWKHYGLEAWNRYGGGTIYRFKHDDLERVQDEIEKKFDQPLIQSLARGFIRVSDKGVRDKLRRITEEEDQVNKYANINIKEYITGRFKQGTIPTQDDFQALYFKIAEDVQKEFEIDYSTIIAIDDFVTKSKNFRKDLFYVKENSTLSTAINRYGFDKTIRALDKYNSNKITNKILEDLRSQTKK